LRFAVSKSHKLFLAALLLGGGYAVALLLGSLSNWIVPQSADRIAAGGPVGVLEPMSAPDMPAVPRTPAPVAANGNWAALNPTPREVRSVSQSPIEAKPMENPTWLAATSPPAVDIAAPIEPPAPPPQANVTDVSPWGTATVSASPWDRWPRWEPSTSSTDSKPENVRFEGANGARSQAIQASYQPAGTDWTDDASESRLFRTHIVVDGDSLAKLADRYLDDPQLANDIYELNRGVLTSPDLLPIGVELRIPERHMARATSAAATTTRRAAIAKPDPPRSFVPVDDWLDRANDVPRAQLLQPVAIGGG
jgi:hypothetical protein